MKWRKKAREFFGFLKWSLDNHPIIFIICLGLFENLVIDSRCRKRLLAGWIAYVALRAGLGWTSSFLVMRAGYILYIIAKDWLLFAMLVVLRVWTYHLWKQRRSK